VSKALLGEMGGVIAHRGPDAEGHWIEPGLGLVHRRLSIIDLSSGDQPIGNEDGSVQVVFNGEIYNFHELRRRLQAKGHRFVTTSDTEVLVHLYEDVGDALVEQLRGMFAFALWDRQRRRLLLARDRVGQKPLYVYRDRQKLIFGSELKAILAHPDVDREVEPTALEDYFTLGFVPGEKAILRRVSKLPAGHVLAVTAETLDAKPREYWRWNPAARKQTLSLEQWQEMLRAKIDETVRLHTIADVPVGAFLSGGLDSSVVVSTLARDAGQPVKTFSIGFAEGGFSELPYAREVAQSFGCEQTEEVVTPDAVQSLDELTHFYDEPFADSSAIPTLCVSRLARQSVKVALSGDGGDECFGGYARYAHDLWEAGWRDRLPAWFRHWALRPLASQWPKADWLPRLLRAKTLLTNLSLDASEAYANTLSLCRMPMRRRLINSDVAGILNGHRPEQLMIDAYRQAAADDPLSGMIAADVANLLPDDFLTKVDRASMACGLEVRPPLVDHELLELAASMPSDLKVRDGETKWIFKRTYEKQLPPGLAWRTKQGFEIPLDAWLRGPLRGIFQDIVLSPRSRVADLIDQEVAARLFESHLSRIGRHGAVIWALLVLACWAERYLPARLPTARMPYPLAIDRGTR
jgi:asparagine synthase (glutamine-hydrolysing)